MGAVATQIATGAQPEQDDATAQVRAAQAGDRQAFARLYRSHARTVHGILLSRMPRSELGDAMQEVFAVALGKLGSLRDPARFVPWLASIARNHARDWARRRSQAGPACELSGAEPAASRELDDALLALDALEVLGDDERELMVLRFVAGMTGPEIAAAIGMTPGSVRVKLHRGVTKLRRRLVEPSHEQPNKQPDRQPDRQEIEP